MELGFKEMPEYLTLLREVGLEYYGSLLDVKFILLKDKNLLQCSKILTNMFKDHEPSNDDTTEELDYLQ